MRALYSQDHFLSSTTRSGHIHHTPSICTEYDTSCPTDHNIITPRYDIDSLSRGPPPTIVHSLILLPSPSHLSLSSHNHDLTHPPMQAIHLPSFHPLSQPFTSLPPTTVPLPTPGPNDILIRTTHISIQQVDLLYARGLHQNNNPKKGHIQPPFTLGLGFAGVVVSTPASRSHPPTSSHDTLKPGTRVFGSSPSSFAQFIRLPASSLQPIPSSLTPADAAALVSGVVSHTAVRRVAGVQAGQTVLVTGVPGSLALVAAQSAQAAGAKVLVLARNAGRAEAVKACLPGVEVLGGEGWKGEVKRLTNGKGVDVIIDNVGVVKEGLSLLAFGGTIVLVGFAGRQGVMEAVEMNRVLLKGAKVVGYRFGEGARRGLYDVRQCWEGYLAAIERGEIKAVVDAKTYKGLGDVGRAMDDLEHGRLVGKAVVDISDSGSTRAGARL
ncbi:hypothetical protein BDZ85DRAFT_262087 [Elsinoe ampelina]|uniref:Enoyl reductase (ER) domain-containing protein n=1 Tax=Elsinoe ampelina TaxID=302913 RepID=A0A6A6GDK5_9PEZI|nr:hypothetical protein BDZ85DRAFT_262087 [Elsinoe ampelina]